MMLKMRTTRLVYAGTHTIVDSGKAATNGDYAANFWEPHATISPSDTRVIFGSDWYDSGSVDSFVLELLDYMRP